ncbi:MAG: hypothetical protein ACM3PA_01220 [Methanomassiliicoccales archaeon]
MYKKLILLIGAVGVILSLTMPVTDILPPSTDGSIIFTWNPVAKTSSTNIPATTSRTLAIASGAMLIAFVLPDRPSHN